MGKSDSPKAGWLSSYRERRADRRARRAARRALGGGGDPAEVRRDAVSQQNVFFPDKPKR
jgi:hypothetical protein